jgi:hypothetical protein
MKIKLKGLIFQNLYQATGRGGMTPAHRLGLLTVLPHGPIGDRSPSLRQRRARPVAEAGAVRVVAGSGLASTMVAAPHNRVRIRVSVVEFVAAKVRRPRLEGFGGGG